MPEATVIVGGEAGLLGVNHVSIANFRALHGDLLMQIYLHGSSAIRRSGSDCICGGGTSEAPKSASTFGIMDTLEG